MTDLPALHTPAATTGRLRLGFLGCGWIGRHRLRSLTDANVADVVMLADPAPDARAEARAIAGDGAACTESFDALLEANLDGLVIATPSAQHADQAIAALERGVAVFCQKPLGRTRAETRRVIDAARAADRLLGVDLSYRGTRAMQAVRDLVGRGELGTVYAADLTFHNAYGPDKAWFYDADRAGGGCLMDLGVHLVDLALWTLGWPAVERVSGRLMSGDRPLVPGSSGEVEDYAIAQLDVAGGALVRIACSWKLPAGADAVIEASFYGTRGGAAMKNVGGSFWDFRAVRLDGCRTQDLVEPPDAWGGRVAVAWARQLARSPGFDPEIERAEITAAVLDEIYGR